MLFYAMNKIAMIDTLLDIPYEIITENIEIDCDSVVIYRTYRLPKSLFKSPNDYLFIIRKYERRKIIENGYAMFINTTGWKDPKCRSFGIMIIIEKDVTY